MLWGDKDVVAEFSTDEFTDRGEQSAFATLGTHCSGDVLDIGVGGGRTTRFLAGAARSYVGIDIAGSMLELARERCPGTDLRLGDVRDLHEYADESFDLVVFSFNGLDSLDHRDRARALAEMARVLAPDGRLLFSSLNQDGVSFDERPWTLRGFRTRRAWRHLALAARHPATAAHGVGNYRRTRRLSEDGKGWARRPMRAHEFRFVVHFATMEETVAEARSAGLDVVAAFAEDGTALDLGAAHTSADYVHFICRRS